MALQWVSRSDRLRVDLGERRQTVCREIKAQRRRANVTVPTRRTGALGNGQVASQALSSGAPQRATMACGAEARAAMVIGADLWLAEAAVPDRPGHADIPRSDLSQSSSFRPRGVLKKGADGALAYQTSDAPPQKPQRQEWAGAHLRYGLDPRPASRGRGSCRAEAIGKATFLRRSERYAHRHTD